MSKKIWVFTLIMSLAISLSACNGSTSTVSEKTSSSVQPTSSLVEETREEETTDDQEAVVSQNNTGKVMDEEGTGIAQQETLEKRESQNSFSMMYYLAITAEQIRIAKDNRLMLEDIYTSLLNDINPSAVDEITQDQLKSLRDILKSFLNISVKRDRLQFIYNQNKASAIRSAVPNPLAILSMTQSFDWKRLAISVTYSLVDSYNSYKKADEKANLDFLMSGWDLDDEETATIQRNRDHAFDYMVDMVQEYHLDGMKTLNEKAIGKFAEISAIESIPEKIRRLVSEEETYSLLGSYWLELYPFT